MGNVTLLSLSLSQCSSDLFSQDQGKGVKRTVKVLALSLFLSLCALLPPAGDSQHRATPADSGRERAIVS